MTQPRVALVANSWTVAPEQSWYLRQLAGALACAADVHVFTPEPADEPVSHDGVFVVHRLGNELEARHHHDRGGGDAAASDDGWGLLVSQVEELGPELLVAAGPFDAAGADAIASISALPQVVRVPLVAESAARASAVVPPPPSTRRSLPADPILRSDVTIVATADERAAVLAHGAPAESVHLVRPTVTADPSARSEPNSWVGDTGSLIVVTGAPAASDRPEAALGRLLRLHVPDTPVGIVASDNFDVWHEGRLSQGWAIERRSDLVRLLAWAGVVVDLRPGPYVARPCVDALTYGVPIVVPEHRRAREYAAAGGGLWFAWPDELLDCVATLQDPSVRNQLGAQGRAFVESEFGPTAPFIDRVLALCGLERRVVVGHPAS